jgi:hypothetical protein
MLSNINPNLDNAVKVLRTISEAEARNFISESVSTLETCANGLEKAMHYTQLAVAHKKKNQHQLAHEAYTAAIQSVVTEDSSPALANAYSNRAYAYLDHDNEPFGFSKAIVDLETAITIHSLPLARIEKLMRLFLIRALHPMCQFILTDRCPQLRPFAQAALIQLSAKYLRKNDLTRVELFNFYLSLSVKWPDLNLPEPYLFEFLRKQAESQKLSAAAWERIKNSTAREDFVIQVISDTTEELTNAQGYAAAQLLTTRGLSYMSYELYGEAIEDFNAAIDLIDDSNVYANSIALFNRGLAYFHNKQTDNALVDFNSAIGLSQCFTYEARYAEFISCVYSARAYLHIEKINFDSACADIVSALQAHSSSIYLNNLIDKLYHGFQLEYFAYCLTPDCNSVLREHAFLSLNKSAAAINLSTKKARLHQEILNFYLRLLVTESIANKSDFDKILNYAIEHRLSDKARIKVKGSVKKAYLRQQKSNPDQALIDGKNDRILITRCDLITQENAEKVIADYSEIIALATTPFDKARALGTRANAYMKMRDYSFAINDLHTVMSLLTAEDMKNQRAEATAYLSEAYYHMDNYPKAVENIIKSYNVDTRSDHYRSELLKLMVDRYFFQMAELILQPECPQSLRSSVQSILDETTEISLLAFNDPDPIHVELCLFYLELSKNKLREFTDNSQTTSKVLELAQTKDLSTEALQRIQNADKSGLAEKNQRRLDYYESKKLRYFDFFKKLPPPVLRERPASPIPELRI